MGRVPEFTNEKDKRMKKTGCLFFFLDELLDWTLPLITYMMHAPQRRARPLYL